MNPFAAHVAPSSGRGGVLSDMEAGMDKGMTVPLGLDRAARSAAIRSEADSGIGNHTGPGGAASAGDLGLEVFGVNPVDVVANADFSGVTGAMINAGLGSAALGAAGAAALTGLSGGAAAPSIPLVTAQAGVSGAVGAGLGKVSEAIWDSYQKEKKKNEDKKKEPPAAGTPPPAGSTPPPEEKKADTPTPPPPEKAAPEPREKKDPVGSTFDPMRGGQTYEANRDAYLGHADGTPIGARGTGVAMGAADPRRTNPGRDGEQHAPTGDAGRNVGAELTLTNETRARNDARAATLGNMQRVTGRVVITDANSDDNNGGGGRPKGNGLVR